VPIPAQRVVFPRPGEVEIEAFELPDPGSHQLLVRTTRTAVSAGTELTGLLGAGPRSRFPAYPGYSHVGVVERVGDQVTGFAVGDRVLSMGKHQTHVLLDLSPHRPGGPEYVERVPAGLAPEHAAFAILGSVSLHGVRRAELQIGQSAAVFGQGIVGQLLVQLARAAGCDPVIGIDVVGPRLEEARMSGAHVVVDASRDDPVQAVERATGGNGAEAVFDATRTPRTLPVMMKAAAMGGRVLVVGSVMGTVEIDAFTELQLKELSIVGCFQPAAPLEPHHFLPWTQRRNRQIFMQMAASGAIKLEHLITHRVAYQRAPETFDMIKRGGTDWLGIVFTWD
jgi:L-iditol 2-dehydrogenase